MKTKASSDETSLLAFVFLQSKKVGSAREEPSQRMLRHSLKMALNIPLAIIMKMKRRSRLWQASLRS
jgi:hypothetical protein